MSRNRSRSFLFLGSFAVVGLLACASTTTLPDGGEIPRYAVPDPSIDPPASEKVVAAVLAVGSQDYTCQALDGGYGWSAAVPEAKLYDGADTTAPQVGTHSAGPTWTWEDGSSAVGDLSSKVALTVDATAIAWLLLPVKSNTGTGVLSSATHVQRLATAGGLAPAASNCDAASVGTVNKSGYSANYYFFEPR